MLNQLSRDEDTVRYPPLPQWFFVTMAAIVAGLALAQLLTPSDEKKATVGLGIAAVALGSRYWLHRDGVSWVSPKLSDMGPFLLAILGSFAVSAVIDATTGAWWIWIVAAAAAGIVVLRTGATYRREFGE